MTTLRPSRTAATYIRLLMWLVPRRALLFRAARVMAERGRSVLVAAVDLSWKYTFCGRELLLPMSHDLPLIMAGNPSYGTNLRRLAEILARHYPDRSIVDVGANIGDTVVLVRSVCDLPIVCVEGDPVFSSYLVENVSGMPDVYVRTCFVDWDTGERRVPVRARGTATLTPSSNGVKGESLATILDDAPRLGEPVLLKVDTDGGDGAILRAATDLLERARPVIFFEYDPRRMRTWGDAEPESVFCVLERCGYDLAIVYDNNGRYLRTIACGDAEAWGDLSGYLEASTSLEYVDVACFHRDVPATLPDTVVEAERRFIGLLATGDAADARSSSRAGIA